MRAVQSANDDDEDFWSRSIRSQSVYRILLCVDYQEDRIVVALFLFKYTSIEFTFIVLADEITCWFISMSRIIIALIVVLCVSCTYAFQPLRSVNSLRSTSTRVNENFGFKFAEDPYENTPDTILGEVNLKDGKNNQSLSTLYCWHNTSITLSTLLTFLRFRQIV